MPALGLSTRWIDRRQPSWERLEALVDACARRGVRALAHEELRELALLYRQSAADLSVLRGDPASAPLARDLNGLLGRAHNVIYSGAPPAPRGILHFYRHVYPRVFRETFAYTLTAALIFAGGMLTGAVLAAADPTVQRILLGPEMSDTIERGEMWTRSIVAIKPLASSAITTNNLSVSFAAFAGGILGGVGTVYMMLFNGLLIGVIGVACQRAGLALQLWSFVAPHGVLELPAIFIAGGAGLLLARGLLAPGLESRSESLGAAAAIAVRLVLGVVPLLLVAGLIEGFLSPSSLPIPVKFLVAAAGALLLGSYVWRAGRGSEQVALLHV